MRPDYNYTKVDNANSIIFELLIEPSTIETIDVAFFTYINDSINLSSDTNEGFKKTPVIWSGAERSFQAKRDQDLREEGSLKFPLISVERKSLEKNRDFKGAFQAHFPEGSTEKRLGVPVARRIVSDKTSNFMFDSFYDKNAQLKYDPKFRTFIEQIEEHTKSYKIVDPKSLKKIVYQTVYGPIPTYVKVVYTITIKTNYQQQMNDLVIPFVTKTGQINAFNITSDGHRYEAFVEPSYTIKNNIINLDVEERFFETSIDFRVLGYLMGEGPNSEKPKYSFVENFVSVAIPRERVILQEPNQISKNSFYRR